MSTIILAQVIGYIETKNDPEGFRFEPAVYSSLAVPSKAADGILATIQHIHACSLGSAKVIYSSSFGAYQIMGFNLYSSLEVKIRIWDFVKIESAQINTFYLFMQQKKIDYTVDQLAASSAARMHFATIYNGAPSYAELIVESLEHFGIKVTQ